MIDALVALIAEGIPASGTKARPLLEALFGDRYRKTLLNRSVQIRDALDAGSDKGVSFAGLIHPDNPTSGPYGGASLIWFPTKEHGIIITFVVGSNGLSPDEGPLSRPGHRRRIAALGRYLSAQQITAWTKEDPTALGVEVPKGVEAPFPGFEAALKRYGNELYAIAKVPEDPDQARMVVQAFFELYAFQRGWEVLVAHQQAAARC